jgi:hypothetical protein
VVVGGGSTHRPLVSRICPDGQAQSGMATSVVAVVGPPSVQASRIFA